MLLSVRVLSANADAGTAFAEGAFTDSDTADATNITLTGANPTATTAITTPSPAEHTAAKQLDVQQHRVCSSKTNELEEKLNIAVPRTRSFTKKF